MVIDLLDKCRFLRTVSIVRAGQVHARKVWVDHNARRGRPLGL